MAITKTAAITGTKTAVSETTVAVPVSIVETTGFPRPPVVAVEASLLVAEAPLIAEAVPPPAIIARVQVIRGSISVRVETITAVPAIAAKGTARLSSRLSTQGI